MHPQSVDFEISDDGGRRLAPATDRVSLGPSNSWTGTGEQSRNLLLALIATVALLQLHLVFVQGINWDEFYFLSHIYQAREGSLHIALQTFHVRLFAWLPAVPGGEIGQITAARIVMLACELIVVAGIVAVARQFVSASAALTAGLAFIAGGYVFQHGFSFRADILAAALLMTALVLVLRGSFSPLKCIAVASLVAVAGLVTIKSAFYAPAFLGVAALRLASSPEPRVLAIRLAMTGVLCLALFAALYLAHDISLQSADIGSSEAVLGSASDKMFSKGWLPQPAYLIKAILLAPLLAGLILAAPFAVAASSRSRPEKLALAGLLLPLAALLIYRNSFPYFYAFILPPAVAAAAVVLQPLVRRYGVVLVASILVLNAGLLYTAMPKGQQRVQSDIIRAAHLIFPQPVAYIDFCSMLASFPKKGFFMSSWGMDNYRDAGRPVFASILAEQPVPLLVANRDGFTNALLGVESEYRFLPQDAATLRSNYIHHWGPLWVAGKSVGANDTDTRVEIEGDYTLERQSLTINGRVVEPGQTIRLARGVHRISGSRAAAAVLRWGRKLPRPSIAEPTGDVFLGF